MSDIVERATKALEGVTGGEWAVDNDAHSASSLKQFVCQNPPDGEYYGNSGVYIAHVLGPDSRANARFIAFARTGVPELLEEVKRLREAMGNLCASVEKMGFRKLVADWNGEEREDGPYDPHHPELGVSLKTTAGTVYEIDRATVAARALLPEVTP